MPICGNFDTVRDILCDTPESIRAVSEACYVEVRDLLMVNAGCGIPSSTSPEIFQSHCTSLAWKA
jgi:uroporphyrinogen-III decarboxylase